MDYNRTVKIGADVSGFEDGMRKLGAGTNQANRQLSELSRGARDTANNLSNGFQQTAGKLGFLISGIGQFAGALNASHNPAAQTIQDLTRIAGAALQGFTAFGPWGAALGGITAALPVLQRALSESRAEVQNSVDTYTALALAVSNARKEINELKGATTLSVAEAQELVSAGESALESAQNNVLLAEDRLQRAEAQTAGLQDLLAEQRQIRREQLARAQAELTAAEATINRRRGDLEEAHQRQQQMDQEAAATTEAENQRLSTRAQATATAQEEALQHSLQEEIEYAAQRAEIAENNERFIAEMHGEMLSFRTQLDNQYIENQLNGLQRLREQNQQYIDSQQTALTSFGDLLSSFNQSVTANVDQLVDAWNRANDAARGAGQQTISSGRLMERAMQGIGSTAIKEFAGNFGGSFAQAMSAVIQGKADFGQAMAEMARSILDSLFQTYTVKAITELGEGLAALATTWGIPNPSADLHFAAAGVFAGIAGAAGLAEAGVSAAIGSGGNSPGKAASSAQTNGARTQSTGGNEGPTIVNLNLNGTVFETKHQIKKHLEDLLRY